MRKEGGFARRLLLLMCISNAASAPPIATPKPPIPVQISSVTSDGIFQIMRKDLIFQPPDPFLYVLRQLWRDSSKGTVVSLQIYNSDTETASPTDVNPGLFLTRDVAQLLPYSPAQEFLPFDADKRLLQLKCCGCGNGEAPVTFYWPQDSPPFTLGYLTTSEVKDLSTTNTTLTRGVATTPVLCGLSDINIRLFPQVVKTTGAFNPIPAAGRKRRSTTAAKVQVMVSSENGELVVGVERSYEGEYVLSMLPSRKKFCYWATTFYYESYEEYHVGLDGRATSRPCFTLQHVATGLYVVADVLDTIALNVAPNSTGLKLQNATDFESDAPDFPDYRFFVRYDFNYLGRAIHILCPLYHRRFCIDPSNPGSVKVSPVTLSDRRPWPTLVDPPGFDEFFRRLYGIRTISTFDFIYFLDNFS